MRARCAESSQMRRDAGSSRGESFTKVSRYGFRRLGSFGRALLTGRTRGGSGGTGESEGFVHREVRGFGGSDKRVWSPCVVPGKRQRRQRLRRLGRKLLERAKGRVQGGEHPRGTIRKDRVACSGRTEPAAESKGCTGIRTRPKRAKLIVTPTSRVPDRANGSGPGQAPTPNEDDGRP